MATALERTVSDVTINVPCAYYPKKTTPWSVQEIDGKEYLIIHSATFKVPLDWSPDNNVSLVISEPGIGMCNFPVVYDYKDGEFIIFDEGYKLNED